MNDDPTKKLPDDETRYDTQPTITAVLHRLNEIGDNLRAEIETLRIGQDRFHNEPSIQYGLKTLRNLHRTRLPDENVQPADQGKLPEWCCGAGPLVV